MKALSATKQDEMNAKTNTRRSALLAVTALVAGLFAVLGLSAPAGAATDTQYGYKYVTQKEAYLQRALSKGAQVLSVGTPHDNSEGFWYAKADATARRGFSWVYQTYGMWCGNQYATVVWSGYLNMYSCQVDEAPEQAQNTVWWQRTVACRTSTGYPWKVGTDAGTDRHCYDDALDWRATIPSQAAASGYECAPFESDDPDGHGCDTQYDFEANTPNSPEAFWTPAPDTCTGLKSDYNYLSDSSEFDPAPFTPDTGGDSTCDGSAFAPNCPAAGSSEPGATNKACTGVDEVPTDPVQVPVTETSSATVSISGSGVATATATAVRGTVKQTASVKKKGHTYKATASAPVYMTATVQKTGYATQSASGTGTRTCTAETEAEAKSCAADLAHADAVANARANAQALANQQAQANAAAAARAAADQAARTVKVSAAAQANAKKRAKAAALKAAKAKAAKHR